MCKWFIYESSSYANETHDIHSIIFHFSHLFTCEFEYIQQSIVFLRSSENFKNPCWFKWWDSAHHQFFGILRRINKLDREKEAHKNLKSRSNGVAFFTNFSLSMNSMDEIWAPNHFTPYEEIEQFKSYFRGQHDPKLWKNQTASTTRGIHFILSVCIQLFYTI